MEPIEARLRLRPKEPGERRAPSPGEFPLKTPASEVENREMTSERRRERRDASPLVRFSAKDPFIVPTATFTVHTFSMVVVARYASLYRKPAAEWWFLLDHIHIRPPGLKQRKNSVRFSGCCQLGFLFGQRESWTEVKRYWRPFVPRFGWLYHVHGILIAPLSCVCLLSRPMDPQTLTD